MRIRLVTETNGTQDVAGHLLAHDEIGDALQLEENMHRASGWHVDRFGEMIRAEKGTVVRWIWPRTRNALEDTL